MSGKQIAAQAITSLLLFLLVMGMASTVDFRDLRKQLRNFRAVCTGLFCQFVLLPFLGFVVVKIFSLEPPVGITLIIVVSSPGGSYSNWWCSLLNADLGLSVSMTTASTLLSVGFLPLNLALYTYAAYGNADGQQGQSIFESIDFAAIFYSLAVVIAAIGIGIFCSWKFDTPRWHRIAYLGGNVSGVLLILFSIVLSFAGGADGTDPTTNDELTTDDPVQYLAIPLPCLFGIIISTVLASLLKLPKPERLTTAVECCYQNTGIATSAALSLFEGEELQAAMRVPMVYGIFEAVAIGLYLIVFWKIGWSKAPKEEKCCTVIAKSYELHAEVGEDDDEQNDDTREDDWEENKNVEEGTATESLSEPLLEEAASGNEETAEQSINSVA